MIYIINKKGKPLTPSNDLNLVNELLLSGKAIKIATKPLAIMLKCDETELWNHP